MCSVIRVINANTCPQFQYNISRCQQLQQPKKSLRIQRYPSEQKIVQNEQKIVQNEQKIVQMMGNDEWANKV